MSVLVTGAGLIGSLTARMLAERGEDVVLVDIRTPRTPPGDGIAFAEASVTDYDALDTIAATRDVDAVVHTAAVLSTGMRADPRNGLHVNLCGTANLLELARARGFRRLVNASSTTVLYAGFGGFPAAPIPEDAPLRLISERQASLYAITKQATEQLCLHYRDHYGVSAVSLRFAAVLGGDRETPTSVPGRLLAKLLDAAERGATADIDDPLLCWAGKEEFVDARDCARALCAALAAEEPALGVYNIVHPGQYGFDDFVETVRQVAGHFEATVAKPPTTGFAGFPHVRPGPSSVEAAKRELGFACRYDLAESIRYWGTAG